MSSAVELPDVGPLSNEAVDDTPDASLDEVLAWCDQNPIAMRKHFQKAMPFIHHIYIVCGFRLVDPREVRSVKSLLSFLTSIVIFPTLLTCTLYRSARLYYTDELFVEQTFNFFFSLSGVISLLAGTYMLSIEKTLPKALYAHFHFGQFLRLSSDSPEEARQRQRNYREVYWKYCRYLSLNHYLTTVVVVSVGFAVLNTKRIIDLFNGQWSPDYDSSLDRWLRDHVLGTTVFSVLYIVFDFIYVAIAIACVSQASITFFILGGQLRLLIKAEKKQLRIFLAKEQIRTERALEEEQYGYSDDEDEVIGSTGVGSLAPSTFRAPSSSSTNRKAGHEAANIGLGLGRSSTSSNSMLFQGAPVVPSFSSASITRRASENVTQHQSTGKKDRTGTRIGVGSPSPADDVPDLLMSRMRTSSTVSSVANRKGAPEVEIVNHINHIQRFDGDWHQKINGVHFNRRIFVIARKKWTKIVCLLTIICFFVTCANVVRLGYSEGQSTTLVKFTSPIVLMWFYSYIFALLFRDTRLQRDMTVLFGVEGARATIEGVVNNDDVAKQAVRGGGIPISASGKASGDASSAGWKTMGSGVSSRQSLTSIPAPFMTFTSARKVEGHVPKEVTHRVLSRMNTFALEERAAENADDDAVELRMLYRGTGRLKPRHIWSVYRYAFGTALLCGVLMSIIPIGRMLIQYNRCRIYEGEGNFSSEETNCSDTFILIQNIETSFVATPLIMCFPIMALTLLYGWDRTKELKNVVIASVLTGSIAVFLLHRLRNRLFAPEAQLVILVVTLGNMLYGTQDWPIPKPTSFFASLLFFDHTWFCLFCHCQIRSGEAVCHNRKRLGEVCHNYHFPSTHQCFRRSSGYVCIVPNPSKPRNPSQLYIVSDCSNCFQYHRSYVCQQSVVSLHNRYHSCSSVLC